MNIRLPLTVFLAIVACACTLQQAGACLWDRDTKRNELSLLGTQFYDLITGGFPHHGDAYYQQRVEHIGSDLDRLTVDALNDLAVAHIRLGDVAEGQRILKHALAGAPHHYPTLSNLGVAAKKAGDFATAANWIKKALTVNPEGHMGLGDWYLWLLIWRAEHEKEGAAMPNANFLKTPYAKTLNSLIIGKGKTDPKIVDKCRLLLLNEQSSAEAFFYVGDVLFVRGDLHFAFLAYVRAKTLGHPADAQIDLRLAQIQEHFELAESVEKDLKINITIEEAEAAIAESTEWLATFQETEQLLIKSFGQKAPIFSQTKGKLKHLGKPSQPLRSIFISDVDEGAREAARNAHDE